MAATSDKPAPESDGPKLRRHSGVRASTPGRRHAERRHSRFDVQLPVRFAPKGEEPIVGRSLNLSLGGMFVVTDRTCPVGSELRLWLTMPDTTELFFTGTVRWVTPDGLGIQHALLGARDTHVLTEYLASLRAAED